MPNAARGGIGGVCGSAKKNLYLLVCVPLPRFDKGGVATKAERESEKVEDVQK
jgi:hypothetical protein